MRSGIGSTVALLALVLNAVLVANVDAQAIRMGRAVAMGATPSDRDTSESGVFVRDSAIAADKFNLGKRMEGLKEWHKSADVYNEILEKYQDRVVPTAYDREQRPIRYQSVAVAVQERLARWPEEGLSVYRTRFEPAAAMLLDSAKRDDYAALHKVLGIYFVTDSGKKAGIRLMDLYLEGGEFSAAAWIGDRLLQWHPNLSAERPAVLFRTALAYHLGGNADLAKSRFDELKNKFPNEKTTVAGQQVAMVDALSLQLSAKPPVAVGSAEDSWHTFGGDESRALVGNAAGRPGARVYSIPLPMPAVPGLSDRDLRESRSQNDDQWLTIIPAVDRGELFFQDGLRVYAVRLDSGMPLPGWQQTYPQRMGQYLLSGGAFTADFVANLRNMPQQRTITVTDDAVLAVMGQIESRNVGNVFTTTGNTKLVCLDRATGRQRWIADPASLPGNTGNAKNLSFSGCPLVVGDNVYTIARGSTGGGVEDCNVACFDVQSGAFKWSSYVASAQTMMPNAAGMPMATSLQPDKLSHLAFASGRVFVLTNLGAIAAIDAYNGTTLWLALYPRDQARANRNLGAMNRWGGSMPVPSTAELPKPWEFNAALVRDGKVFALPTDGTDLMVLDAGNGDEIKRIPAEFPYSDSSQRLTMLLGVNGDRLVACARGGFFVLDWTKFAFKRPDSTDLADGSVIYASALDLKGRPFVAADQVYLPLASRMLIWGANARKLTDSYPRGGASWPDDEGPGNVIVTRDHVVIANARNISVYTDLDGVRRKYAAAISANPADVDARLGFAEMMFNARELDDSTKALDETIRILGGPSAIRSGRERDRLFSDCVLFAQKLAGDKGKAEIIEQLYDRAAAAAATPSQQVNYRFSRARYAENSIKPNPSLAVRLYQEVLRDPQMRIIMLSGDEASGTIQAGDAAERSINSLIQKAGTACYKPFADEAAQKLASLGADGKPEVLLALAEDYPNAVNTASAAMMQAAASYEKSDNPRMATQVLRRIYWKYSARFVTAERTKLVEALVRNYLRVGNVGAALGRAQRQILAGGDAKLIAPLAMKDGKPLLKANGQPVQTFKDAADAIEQLANRKDDATTPDIKLLAPRTPEEAIARKPIPPTFEPEDANATIANVQSILRPPADRPEGAQHDRVIVWSVGRLACYVPGSNKPLWSSPALTDMGLGLMWSGKQVLVWSETQAAMLDGDTGSTNWHVDVSTLPGVELVGSPAGAVASQPPAIPPVRPAAPPDAMMVAGRRAVRVRGAVIEANGARVAGLVPVAPPPAQPVPQPAQPPVRPADGRERILHVCSLSDRVIISTTTGRICAFHSTTGKLLWQTRLASAQAIQQTLSNEEFVAVRLLTDSGGAQLIVFDTFNGQQVFRKTFPNSANDRPINCILSPEGTLVWTSPTSLAAKDLYESGEQNTWTQTERASYSNLAQPDQLAIWNQQLLVLCDQGHFIERRSLHTGNKLSDSRLRELLGTISSDLGGNSGQSATVDTSNVRIRLSGPRMYAIGNFSLYGYHLDFGTSCPMRPNSGLESMPTEAMITQDYLVLPGRVSGAENSYTLQAYYRLMVNKTESGKQGHKYDFRTTSPVKSFLAVNGGVYYLTTDGTLHWLKGCKK